jgi:hypothetical protein
VLACRPLIVAADRYDYIKRFYLPVRVGVEYAVCKVRSYALARFFNGRSTSNRWTRGGELRTPNRQEE